MGVDGPVLWLPFDSWSEENHVGAVGCTAFIDAIDANLGPFIQDLEEALVKDSKGSNDDKKSGAYSSDALSDFTLRLVPR